MPREFTLRKRVKLLVGNLRSIRDKQTLTQEQQQWVSTAGAALVALMESLPEEEG